ncbi:MAG: hypothetical protein AAGI49_07935 [Bacteroidota bacterium]
MKKLRLIISAALLACIALFAFELNAQACGICTVSSGGFNHGSCFACFVLRGDMCVLSPGGPNCSGVTGGGGGGDLVVIGN